MHKARGHRSLRQHPCSRACEGYRQAKDDEAEGGTFQQLIPWSPRKGASGSTVRVGDEDKGGLRVQTSRKSLPGRCGGVRAQGKIGVARGGHDDEARQRAWPEDRGHRV